jgi:dTDP-4-amino-4,6-dideoxygalactose transaminase
MNNSRPAVLGGSPIFNEFVPMVRPTLPKIEEVQDNVRDMFETGMLTNGKYLREFETQMATHLRVDHVMGVSSCTTGLMLTYRALNLTGEVIVPSFTFMASVSSLVWAGLTPVFVEVDKETTNIVPAAVEAAITPHTSAIVAVHNFGNPADIDALEDIARRHNLRLIFDAAHGLGALYNGRPVGGFGDAEVFSMSPTKLVTSGEGGLVATNDQELARRVRVGREYGNDGHYDTEFPGFNARLAEFNAILATKSLAMLEKNVTHRNRITTIFKERLGQLPGVLCQVIRPEDRCSYREFSIVIDEDKFGLTRDELASALRAESIDTRKYYDPPVHRHRPYRKYVLPGQMLPITDYLSKHSLSLPIYSHMSVDTAEGICNAIERIHRYAQEIHLSLTE